MKVIFQGPHIFPAYVDSIVLQVASVFTNVSKGNLASGRDLMDAFGTSDAIAVCKEILEKGDLQVSEQERQALLER